MDGRDLTGREALAIVDVAENRLHQLLIRNAAVARRIADDRHLLSFAERRGRERNRPGERLRRRGSVHPQQGKVRPLVVFDVQDLGDLKRQLVPAIDLVQEVDRCADPPRDPAGEGEPFAAAARELARDVTVREDGVLVHQPPGAHPLQFGMARQVDASDRHRGAVQRVAGRLQPAPPDFAGAVGELEARRSLHHGEHRPADPKHDRLQRELRRELRPPLRRGFEECGARVGRRRLARFADRPQLLGERPVASLDPRYRRLQLLFEVCHRRSPPVSARARRRSVSDRALP